MQRTLHLADLMIGSALWNVKQSGLEKQQAVQEKIAQLACYRETINAHLASLTALQSDQIKQLMERAQGVSPRGLTHLQAILDQIRILEGLDPDPDM